MTAPRAVGAPRRRWLEQTEVEFDRDSPARRPEDERVPLALESLRWRVKSVDRIPVTREPQQSTAATIALARVERQRQDHASSLTTRAPPLRRASGAQGRPPALSSA